jgi:branched-chain amino acid transport system substrate-binding protein
LAVRTILLRRTRGTLLGTFLLGCILVGCRASSAPLTIGAAGPWDQAYGAMAKRGLDLAVEEINAKGGINGRPLNVIARDDSGDGRVAAGIARDFVNTDSILAVAGHVNSGAMVAAAKVYDGHLAAIATSVTSPDLSGISPWVFRVISSDSVNGADLARFATSLGKKRAAILYENDAYGRGLTRSFERNFTGQIVSADPINPDSQNFEPYVAYYKKMAPDLVFMVSTEGAGIPFLDEARRQKLDATFLGGDGWTGVVADTAASDGVYVGTPFSAEDTRPEAQRFVAAFKARYNGLVPDGNAALEYDAVMLIADALRNGAPTRQGVRDYLASLSAANQYDGVTGKIHFQASGDPVGKSFVMTRVHDGTLVVAGAR